MSLKNKTEEIKRLIAAFEVESAKFYPLNFSLFLSRKMVQVPIVFFRDQIMQSCFGSITVH